MVSETARQLRCGEYDFKDIAVAAGRGATLGAFTAPIGITGRYITRMSGKAVKAAARYGSIRVGKRSVCHSVAGR